MYPEVERAWEVWALVDAGWLRLSEIDDVSIDTVDLAFDTMTTLERARRPTK